MEKYSQYRDKGSGIAPFFPVPAQPSGAYLPFHFILFVLRVPILITFSLTYFFFAAWLPIGSLGKKACLWLILAVPGIWWVDLQIDGVRRGSLGKKAAHLPGPGTVMASSCTSPIDALYLAAIFDPIFTTSYPNSRLLRRTSLFKVMVRSLRFPLSAPPPNTKYLTTLEALIAANPDRCIVVFPECTTTNGRAILPLSPSLLSAPPNVKIFPTSLRYTPADITTPVPGGAAAWTFLWNLCSRPTHTIRVRIAESVQNTSAGALFNLGKDQKPVGKSTAVPNTYATNFLDTLNAQSDDSASDAEETSQGQENGDVTEEEKRVLDRVGEALARLGRVKRVGLGVSKKAEFAKMWTKKRR